MQPLAFHFVLTRLADHSLVYCCISESTPGHFGGAALNGGERSGENRSLLVQNPAHAYAYRC